MSALSALSWFTVGIFNAQMEAKLPQPDDDNAKLGSEWFVDERERDRIEMKGDHI